jgi:prephenate dehydratase
MHINEEFIQSRADGLGGYYFYIEIDGHRLERRVSKAFEAIRESLDPHEKNPELIHIMGSYADSRWKTCELT